VLLQDVLALLGGAGLHSFTANQILILVKSQTFIGGGELYNFQGELYD